MVDLEADLRFPLAGRDPAETVAVGTLLTVVGSLTLPLLVGVVPLAVAAGYLLRVARRGAADAPAPPEFEDYRALLAEGARGLAVVLAYQLPSLAVGGAALAGLALAALSDSRALAGLGLVVLAGGLLLAVALSAALGYVALAAAVHAAREGRLGAAADVATLRQVALSPEYAVAWLYGVGVVLLGSVLANAVAAPVLVVLALVGLIPILGVLVLFAGSLAVGLFTAAVGFYAAVVAARVWGRGYGRALGVHGTAPAGGESGEGPGP